MNENTLSHFDERANCIFGVKSFCTYWYQLYLLIFLLESVKLNQQFAPLEGFWVSNCVFVYQLRIFSLLFVSFAKKYTIF